MEGFGMIEVVYKAWKATEAALALHNYQCGSVDEDENRAKRHACYRVIVAYLMGPLGRGIRIRLPACVIKAVRAKWPSTTYTGFKPSEIVD
ncbi:hypothetical protein PRIPAC_80207 [Pristionchus pacificus]|uniref:Uncharacterized protein n=1 Tax=Pristionchus pacificus TaxID=54126 RepID=A0A2A6BWL7_PRIPA|nr:hypothetical protein PRIPAC_79117 [Pristionchus pacificus]KAF8373778.1 hypothetical protein PRIPAC_80207 [Pristionchus pacificus]|eukprot:PDM70392.1 hypothetical protein PRIPAC_46638 [Pristionchus pacificus]